MKKLFASILILLALISSGSILAHAQDFGVNETLSFSSTIHNFLKLNEEKTAEFNLMNHSIEFNEILISYFDSSSGYPVSTLRIWRNHFIGNSIITFNSTLGGFSLNTDSRNLSRRLNYPLPTVVTSAQIALTGFDSRYPNTTWTFWATHEAVSGGKDYLISFAKMPGIKIQSIGMSDINIDVAFGQVLRPTQENIEPINIDDVSHFTDEAGNIYLPNTDYFIIRQTTLTPVYIGTHPEDPIDPVTEDPTDPTDSGTEEPEDPADPGTEGPTDPTDPGTGTEEPEDPTDPGTEEPLPGDEEPAQLTVRLFDKLKDIIACIQTRFIRPFAALLGVSFALAWLIVLMFLIIILPSILISIFRKK